MLLFILNMEVGYTKFTVGRVIVVITFDVYVSLLLRRRFFFIYTASRSHKINISFQLK